MHSFGFTAKEVFYIAGRGIVFRGRVVSGSTSKGKLVRVETRDGNVTAKVTFITEQRTPITETLPDRELNLLLAEFDRESVNQAIRGAAHAEDDPGCVPSPEELLNIDLPCSLVAACG